MHIKIKIKPRLFELACDARGWIALTVIVGLLNTGAKVAWLVLAAGIIIAIFKGITLAQMFPLALGMVVAMSVEAAAAWGKDVCAQRSTGAIKVALRRRTYDHLLKLGPGYLERKRTGGLVVNTVDGVEALERYFGLYLPHLALCVLVPAFMFVFMAYVDLISAVILVAFVPLVPLSLRVFNKLSERPQKKFWNAYEELSAHYVDSIQGLTTLKLFNQNEACADEIHNRAWNLRCVVMRYMRLVLGSIFFIGAVGVLGSGLALIVASYRLAAGTLTFEVPFLILLIGQVFYEHVNKLGLYYHTSVIGISASKSIFELLDTEPEVRDSVQTAPKTIIPHISLQAVNFAYDGGKRPALNGMSFEVRPGETVALVGTTGSGKSTVVNLLYRFFDPQQGAITLGEHSLPSLPLDFLREQIALVTQDTYLFHGTIADNLRFGKPDATADELISAARVANVHDFIQSLPDGYETQVGEYGVRLSGGERQRIAIARAVLKDAPILLLDEPTSNVDAENEAIIQKALDRLMEGRTVLMIAHRLSTVRNADRILVMEHGRIAESGTHKQLLEEQGIYANLIAAQRV